MCTLSEVISINRPGSSKLKSNTFPRIRKCYKYDLYSLLLLNNYSMVDICLNKYIYKLHLQSYLTYTKGNKDEMYFHY